MNVALIAFIDNGKVLLNRRADAESEMWEFIGGGIEAGELPLEAIKREVFEEISYNLDEKVDDLKFIDYFKYESDKIAAEVHVFKAKHPGVEKFSDSDETRVEDLHLFAIDSALELVLLPMSRIILEKDILFEY